VRVVAAVAPDGRDRAVLRREQLASDRMKARQDRLAISAEFKEGDHAWRYRPARNGVTGASLGSATWSRGPAASWSEDDGSRRHIGAVPGGCSGRATLGREQCYVSLYSVAA
jgi:hypothetical protein